MRNESPWSPAHWSKDFAEHLRTVHLTLIGVATGLILIVLSTKSYNPAIAVRQIYQIQELKKLWSPNWVANADKFILFGPVTKEYIYARVTWDEKRTVTRSQRKAPTVIQFMLPKRNFVMRHAGPVFPDQFPTTLSEFGRFWDALQDDSLRVYFPTSILADNARVYKRAQLDRGHVVVPERHMAEVVILDEKTARKHAPKPAQMDLELSVQAKDFKDFQEATYVDVDADGNVLEIPVSMALAEVNQAILVKHFPNWKIGTFDNAFPDLAYVAPEVEGLELDEAQKVISNEAVTGNEVFETFGMKFPATQITVWGIVILLGVQMYFFLYLKQLSGKLGPSDAAWDVPWLGMDTSRLARGIFFVSVVLLPLFALGTLWWRAISQMARPLHLDFWIGAKIGGLAVAVLATATLGILSWKHRPRFVPRHNSVRL